jgi:hypothetical protein
MDDATNEHYSMFFVDEEGTASSFQGVRDVIVQGRERPSGIPRHNGLSRQEASGHRESNGGGSSGC